MIMSSPMGKVLTFRSLNDFLTSRTPSPHRLEVRTAGVAERLEHGRGAGGGPNAPFGLAVQHAERVLCAPPAAVVAQLVLPGGQEGRQVPVGSGAAFRIPQRGHFEGYTRKRPLCHTHVT